MCPTAMYKDVFIVTAIFLATCSYQFIIIALYKYIHQIYPSET